MNADTRIAIHSYAGDARQVSELLAEHERHACPITVLSPDDSQVALPGVDCRVGGKRQSVGPLAVARQKRHMEILLEYPERFFLMHDADSICLSAKLPDYLYNEPDVLWSNLVFNGIDGEQAAYAVHKLPRLAFQPPVFASRQTIEKLLAVTAAPFDGFIDHWFVQAATLAGVVGKGFPDGLSLPISTHAGALEQAIVGVRHRGVNFIHSVKSPRFWLPLVEAHQGWLEDHRPVGDSRPRTAPILDIKKPDPQEYVRGEWGGDRLTYIRGST